jgi:hypothetical protein
MSIPSQYPTSAWQSSNGAAWGAVRRERLTSNVCVLKQAISDLPTIKSQELVILAQSRT